LSISTASSHCGGEHIHTTLIHLLSSFITPAQDLIIVFDKDTGYLIQ